MIPIQQEDISYKQELDYIEETWPGYLAEFHQLLLDGQVDGSSYFNDTTQCGCLYGWLSKKWGFTFPDEIVLHNLYGEIRFFTNTNLERFIYKIRPGDTPQTNETAAYLEQLLQPYLSTEES